MNADACGTGALELARVYHGLSGDRPEAQPFH